MAYSIEDDIDKFCLLKEGITLQKIKEKIEENPEVLNTQKGDLQDYCVLAYFLKKIPFYLYNCQEYGSTVDTKEIIDFVKFLVEKSDNINEVGQDNKSILFFIDSIFMKGLNDNFKAIVFEISKVLLLAGVDPILEEQVFSMTRGMQRGNTLLQSAAKYLGGESSICKLYKAIYEYFIQTSVEQKGLGEGEGPESLKQAAAKFVIKIGIAYSGSHVPEDVRNYLDQQKIHPFEKLLSNPKQIEEYANKWDERMNVKKGEVAARNDAQIESPYLQALDELMPSIKEGCAKCQSEREDLKNKNLEGTFTTMVSSNKSQVNGR